jgi:predicted nucleotidyltransferase
MKRLDEINVPEAVKERLAAMVAEIVGRCSPQLILLFGSWAEGRPGPESDFDLLVVTETSDPNRLAGGLMWDLSDRDRGVDVIVLTPEAFGHERELPGLVVYRAVKDGVVLYEQAA